MIKKKRGKKFSISLFTVGMILSVIIVFLVVWIVVVELKTVSIVLPVKKSKPLEIKSARGQFPKAQTPGYYYKSESVDGTVRVSIIIDDLGWNLDIAKRIIDIDAPITLAIIPKLKYSRQIAEYGRKRGREIIIHVPMEPHDRNGNPQDVLPLLTSMSRETISNMVTDYIAEVPYAVGTNNHMGSRFTEDKRSMSFFLTEIKKRGLFFIDSLTTSKSVAFKTARAMGIPSVRRSVFLDHEVDIESIRERAFQLERILHKRHSAIAIGHPHQATVIVLQELVERLSEKGVMMVPVSEMLPVVYRTVED